MPVTRSCPGAYVEEMPAGARAISGVATSIAAFVGRALRGPVNEPVRVRSFAEFERHFGGLWGDSTMSYAVQYFFLNGGSDALIVRLEKDGAAAGFSFTPASGAGRLMLQAANAGAWGDNLRIAIDHDIKPLDPSDDGKAFNLAVTEWDPATRLERNREVFRDVSIAPAAPRFVGRVLAQESGLLRLADPHPSPFPEMRPCPTGASPVAPVTAGSDGAALACAEYETSRDSRTGIYALEKADLFNLLCIPPFTPDTDVAKTTWDLAAAYCLERRAFLIVDPPRLWNLASSVTGDAIDGVVSHNDSSKNAALFFPSLRIEDPLQENRLLDFVPCGAVAGVMARIDAQRGVWKAAAGIDATLDGVAGFTHMLCDVENSQIHPLGVNCLRYLTGFGPVVWGSRTLDGAGKNVSEWKYIPVRRLALFIEESLLRGTRWAVFEPNGEPLWGRIRLDVGAFMDSLFRQGAFQGASPREAYFVRCDGTTTTQSDIDRGSVNIVVGFAPIKAAEFVNIQIRQFAARP